MSKIKYDEKLDAGEREGCILKNKSTFSQILTIVIVALVGIVLTVFIAFLARSNNTDIFDFSKLNLANFVPVILIGGFITCVTVGIVVLCVSRNIFLKIRDYFLENKSNGGKKE